MYTFSFLRKNHSGKPRVLFVGDNDTDTWLNRESQPKQTASFPSHETAKSARVPETIRDSSAETHITKTTKAGVDELRAQIPKSRGKVGLTEQGRAIAGIIQGLDGKESPKNLSDVNLASLMRMVYKKRDFRNILNESKIPVTDERARFGTYDYNEFKSLVSRAGYTSDGAFGQTEADALSGFMEYYLSLSPKSDARQKIDDIATYYQRGLDAGVYERDLRNKDTISGKEGLVAFLTDTYSSGIITRENLGRVLSNYLNTPANVQTLGRVLGIGNTSVSVEDIIEALRIDPTLKTKFTEIVKEGITSAQGIRGFRLSTTQFDKILKGELMGDLTESKEKPETILKEKIRNAISQAKNEARGLTGEEREKLLQAINQVEKNQAQQIQSIIRYAGTSLGANIGRGANAVGGSVNFGTIFEKVSLSIAGGLSQGGAFGGGLVARFGDSFEVSKNNDRKISVSGGLSSGVGLKGGVFFGVDGGITVADRINTFGEGFQNAKTHGFSIYATKGIVGASYSQMDNRLETINDYGEKLKNALSRVAPVSDESNLASKLRASLKSAGLRVEEGGFDADVQELSEYMTRHDLWNLDATKQTLGILSFATGKIRQYKEDEGSNTKDAMSFKGWTIGAGHMLGVTFPAVGFTWYRINTDYVDPGQQKAEQRQIGEESIDLTEENTGAIDIELPPGLQTPAMRAFILRSRRSRDFKNFQRELTAGNREQALAYLNTYLSKIKRKGDKSLAQQLLDFVKSNPDTDFTVLSRVNEMTSGDSLSRSIGEMASRNPKDAINYINKNRPKVERMLRERARSGQAKFGGSWGSMYRVDTLIQSLSNPETPLDATRGKKFFGSIDYHQTIGGARGLDQLSRSTQLYGVEQVEPTSDQKSQLVNSLRKTRPNVWARMRTTIGAQSDDQLTSLLMGNSTTINGKTFRVTQQPEFFRGMSGIKGATCFNASEFMTLPEINGAPLFEDIVPTQDFTASEETFSIGITGYREKPKKPEKPTETPTTRPTRGPTEKPTETPTTQPTLGPPPVEPPPVNPPPVEPPPVNPPPVEQPTTTPGRGDGEGGGGTGSGGMDF